MIWQPPVMGSPLVGFGLKPKNNFYDLLHNPDVGGPWYGEGKGRQKDRKLIPATKIYPEVNDPVQYLT